MRLCLVPIITFLIAHEALAAENCTADKKKAVCSEKSVKDKVDWACQLIEKKGQEAVAEIKKMRYDCCGELNYVWINTADENKPIMVMHPMKPQLDKSDLSQNADPKGKKLFVEFAKSVNRKPAGAWVDYDWTKLGEPDPTPKVSWVKRCTPKGQKTTWVVGSGTWK